MSHQGEPWWTIEDPSLPNGWEPHAESLALKARRASLPEGVRPRMDIEEGQPVTQPADALPVAEPANAPMISPLGLAALPMLSSDDGPSSDLEMASSPMTPAMPGVESPLDFADFDSDEKPFGRRPIIDGISSFIGSSMQTSSIQEDHLSYRLFGTSPFPPSALAEGVVIEDYEGVRMEPLIEEDGALIPLGGEPMDVSPGIEPTKTTGRRLPGQGGIRKLSVLGFLPSSVRADITDHPVPIQVDLCPSRSARDRD